MHISVIIPTLNEEAILAETLHAVRAERPFEIIVVDGGSTDGTREEAADADLFLTSERGRGVQMNHAARQARGDAFLFLHADCMLEAGALAAAPLVLRRRHVAACCFRQHVLARDWLYRCIDWCATARVRFTGLAYGDQGLCIRRAVFEALGGFPSVPLLEDLLFSRRLRRQGRIVVAPKRIFVSPRRWRRTGLVRQTLRNWGLTALTATGVGPERLARLYPIVR
jgi:rSAM/selenodomain-associated transferase 2